MEKSEYAGIQVEEVISDAAFSEKGNIKYRKIYGIELDFSVALSVRNEFLSLEG